MHGSETNIGPSQLRLEGEVEGWVRELDDGEAEANGIEAGWCFVEVVVVVR